MSEFNTIITGTGRCGTGYFAALLNSMNLNCGHESIFDVCGLERAKDRISGRQPISLSCTCGESPSCKETCMSVVLKDVDKNNLVADSSYLAAPFLDDDFFKKYNFIHILRNPISVIKSFVQVVDYFKDDFPEHSRPFQNFIKKYLKDVYDNDFSQADRGYLYYFGWNKMILEKIKNRNHIVYKVEENNENKILNFLGKENCDFSLKNEKINHWQNRNEEEDLDFNVFKKEVEELILKYREGEGYGEMFSHGF